MHPQIDTPAPWIICIIILIVIFVVAFGISRYEDEDIAPVVAIEPELEVARFEPSLDFCEWWTPDILDHYAEIEKMATLPGRHPVKNLNNLITPIVPQWYGNKQDSI